MTRRKKRLRSINNEKRIAERLNIPLKLQLKLPRQRRVLTELFAKDVSGAGVRVVLKTPLPKGRLLRILISFPGDPRPVLALSRIVWCKKTPDRKQKTYDVGIRYAKIDPKDKRRFLFLFCETMMNFFLFGNAKS